MVRGDDRRNPGGLAAGQTGMAQCVSSGLDMDDCGRDLSAVRQVTIETGPLFGEMSLFQRVKHHEFLVKSW